MKGRTPPPGTVPSASGLRFKGKLLFETPDQFAAAIEEYFDRCEATNKPPTQSGMAVALGTSKQTLHEYGARNGYTEIFGFAMTYMEAHYEARLSGNNVAGAIFWLKNRGWRDNMEVTQNHNWGSQSEEELGRALRERMAEQGIDDINSIIPAHTAPSTTTEH